MTDVMLVGQTAEGEDGMRVVVTESGRTWEIEKAGRGDCSQGGQGTVVEIREEGKLCFVQWDATEEIFPYATGLHGRFFLALAPSAAADLSPPPPEPAVAQNGKRRKSGGGKAKGKEAARSPSPPPPPNDAEAPGKRRKSGGGKGKEKSEHAARSPSPAPPADDAVPPAAKSPSNKSPKKPRKEDSYTVEAVVGKQMRNGEAHYLVKWQGYASSEV